MAAGLPVANGSASEDADELCEALAARDVACADLVGNCLDAAASDLCAG